MKQSPRELEISDYNYLLPEDVIARYPLPTRDQSKLLQFQNDGITEHQFSDLATLLRPGDTLIMNSTKVIPARLFFKKATGGMIEVFCLEPASGSHQDAMVSKSKSIWKCLVGGAKKWKGDEVITCEVALHHTQLVMSAKLSQRLGDAFLIEFSWTPQDLTFSEVLFELGKIPLPPYFDREVELEDINRYQTVFARYEGSVAAPTAGLHFTDELIEKLKFHEVDICKLVLHVGAGTFKPVSSMTIGEHEMHGETFSVDLGLLKKLLITNKSGRIIAVGTTVMRTLESLYWFGVKILNDQFNHSLLTLRQWEAYELESKHTLTESLEAIIQYCEQKDLKEFSASTSIMIAPGFQFRICNGLVTNFHLPQSTLLVLVSAFIGEKWKTVYDFALTNQFRFLSYGDSSLLWKK